MEDTGLAAENNLERPKEGGKEGVVLES